MNVLIIGSGGRENALAWAVKKSPKVDRLFIAPGNGGSGRYGTNVPLTVRPPFDDVIRFNKDNAVELTIIGPEQPLTSGIVDVLQKNRMNVFGPTRMAARLEGSKVYMKDFLSRYAIPTARFRTFDRPELAIDYVNMENKPCVVKTDGLAAGKGAIVCRTLLEARAAIQQIMVRREFGDAGSRVVIEDFLEGTEVSVFVVTDGSDFKWLASAQDHKTIFDNDQGPNTGGMGAYAPAPFITEPMKEIITENIIKPTLRGLIKDGHPYTGILYLGLMLTRSGPSVIEYNVRFGDPEAQVVLPLLETDFVDIAMAVSQKRLSVQSLKLADGFCTGVVMAAHGYPGEVRKGDTIQGSLDDENGIQVFHAGTRLDQSGNLLTDGGRVLCVTALGKTLQDSVDKVYEKTAKIKFAGMQYRKDIGQKGLKFFSRK